MKTFSLIPADGRKSFYGKCYVIEDGAEAILFSYDRKIITYNIETGTVETTSYYNYSMTTRRHQKAFCKLYNIQEVKA